MHIGSSAKGIIYILLALFVASIQTVEAQIVSDTTVSATVLTEDTIYVNSTDTVVLDTIPHTTLIEIEQDSTIVALADTIKQVGEVSSILLLEGVKIKEVTDSIVNSFSDKLKKVVPDAKSLAADIKRDSINRVNRAMDREIKSYLTQMANITHDSTLLNEYLLERDSIFRYKTKEPYTSISEYLTRVTSYPCDSLVDLTLCDREPNVAYLPLRYQLEDQEVLAIEAQITPPTKPQQIDYTKGITSLKPFGNNKNSTDRVIEQMRRRFVQSSPKYIHDTHINADVEVIELKELKHSNTLNTLVIVKKDAPKTKANIMVVAPKKDTNWVHSYTSSVQFSQAYISANWYQGGESNLNLLNAQTYNVSFDNKKKLIFTSQVLWRLGLSTTPTDTVHNMSINEDLFQATSMFGIKAVKDWYYTLSMNFSTQLFNTFESNSNTRSSAFFSPGDLNLGVGMSYNYTSTENLFKVSVILAPLSYNLKFSLDEQLAINAGIPEGDLTLNQLGFSIESNFSWAFYQNITWTARAYYFSDYKSTLSELETGFNFAINKYFSTILYLQARYDDQVVLTTDTGYFQFKEMLTIGFNYTI